MTVHLQRDLDHLRKQILTMGSLVEESINKAINALVQRLPEVAEEVIEADSRIDETEVEVEEDCLKLLALHQPVAIDLRFIITCLKVNNDLERMGDLAVNIAQRAAYLARHPKVSLPVDFTRMADRVRAMVRDSLDALVRGDAALARRVIELDDQVDRDHRHIFDLLQESMFKDPSIIKRLIAMLSSSRYLERIADHATNISEDLIFMSTGEIIRHRGEVLEE
jgi:phosphate transport system protein